MKEIIFIFLISNVFSVYYIKKHGSVKVSTGTGIVYLNADKFGKNDEIHMQFNAYRSSVDDKIYYEFSDDIPTDTFQPSKSKNPDNSWSSSTGGDDETDDSKTTYKTNYDIKKNVSKKYLVIKYTGYYNRYSGGYLKIENTLINWGEFFIWFIVSIFILVFSVFFSVFCYCKFCKKRCKPRRFYIEHITATELPKTNDNTETPPQEKDIFYEPSGSENADQNYDSNNIPQPQNIYYEPPKVENVDTINDSNSSIPQQQNIYYEPPNSAIDNYYPNKNSY